MKRKYILLILCILGLQLTACDRQSTIARFNNLENTEVDNFASEEKNVENMQNLSENGTENLEGTEWQEPTEVENVYDGPEVSVLMVGDILLHTPVAASGLQEDGIYNFDEIFSHTGDEIAEADLALVNEEVIIGGEEMGVSGYPCFNAPYELGDALVNAGFDVALHATNHALDQGKKGIKNCLTFWETSYPNMAVLGINGDAESQEAIFVYEQDGIRIAILNYTYGTNGIEMPSDMPFAVNMLEKEKVVADIQKAEEEADFVIVCPHWGTEYQLTETREQQYWTDIFLENGVDLVIGTHPHVIEPIRWVSDEAGNEMLVYYSLGNFVNWTSSSGEGIANRMVGGMAEVTIGMDQEGEAFILEYGIEPVVCHVTEGVNGVTVYPLSEYSTQLAGQNAIISQDGAFSKEYCENLCAEVWGELYLSEQDNTAR